MSRTSQVRIIENFLDWLHFSEPISEDAKLDREALRADLARYADEVLFECDTAIMHGPGHQSISECQATGVHTEHYNQDYGFEWSDSDIGTQTHDKHEYHNDEGGWRKGDVIRTYRLASGGH